tara:strand:+ start:1687 stop:2142 length:456 start_codon:yes stop_codon:yes gene_type:complete
MTAYKRESHIRSLLKGISWRVIATSDTILLVLLITCLTGNCSIENAIKIGFIEFVIKLLAYYLHERIWQKILIDKKVTKKKTLQKSISWRIIATVMTFLISGSVLNAYDEMALYIALTELFTKLALYYLHERFWLKLPLGRIRYYIFGKKQ